MIKKKSLASLFVLLLLYAICILPFAYVLFISLRSLEGSFTLKYYYETLLGQSQYLFRFWKSIGLSVSISIGQVFVSVLAGYSFAKCKYPGKNALFILLMILMVLPVQVTLIPNYIIMKELGILETYVSLALPAIIFPLGTFIMSQSFRSIPNNVIEAARLDGCRLPRLIVKIVLPMCKNALVCTFLLSFLDAWNMVEQPITYLKNFADYPIAVALASVPPGDPTVMLSACVLITLPPLFLFALFNRELTEGIALGGEH